MKNKITALPGTTLSNKTGGWRTFKPKYLPDKCTACGACARICPEGIIEKHIIKNKPYYNCDFNYCKGCSLCATECPVKAIIMEIEEK